MDFSKLEKNPIVKRLMSPWVLVIVSLILIGGAGTVSALVAVGVITP